MLFPARELYISHPPCFPPTICLPHRSVESHRSSQREREHGNRLVNTSSHPPTNPPISQLNRNVWEDRRGIKCCWESKTLVLLASTFPLTFVTLVMFYASSYIFRSRAGSSNSSTQTSDLYPVGIINILTESRRYAVGKPQSHVHKTKEALSLMVSQLCTYKERTLWIFSSQRNSCWMCANRCFFQAYNFRKFDQCQERAE